MSHNLKAERVAALAREIADTPEAAGDARLSALRAELEALARTLPGAAPAGDGAGDADKDEAAEARFDNMPV